MDRKIALITGAGSGIGRVTALALWQADYSIVLAGRREDKLRETWAAAGVGADRALIVPTDVSDRGAVVQLFAETKRRFGRLDLLFNNAGINAPAIPLEDLSESQWLSVVGVNLTGAFWCLQEAYKMMKAQQPQGGRIINNGSISAHVPRPHSVVYTATKHAMTGLTKSTALDGRDYNIACGQIDIGNARTEMSDRQQKRLETAAESAEPQMDARHVADAVIYMANLPLNANVLFMTVMANGMPYVGRG
ncbi:MAG: SDR family oxidoreductase [Anaerolineae bacterium]|nr:SDR family oxidoreductase [Anaerolineae bacterium]